MKKLSKEERVARNRTEEPLDEGSIFWYLQGEQERELDQSGAERMKARKIPTTVDVVQWVWNTEEVQEFTGADKFRHLTPRETTSRDDGVSAEVYDELHNTWVGVKTGNWIIKGVNGEFYPCDDQVFRKTYELLEEE